jgi:hypothetical protein
MVCDLIPRGTELAEESPDTNAARAALHRSLQGEQSMTQPHNTQDQHAWQEHQLVKELLMELQAIDAKSMVEVRFYELMD